uniref:Uncharacterized protein n=1 Tax=Rhizophora mucronata TaxID=61149 RepID=A0A2P2PLI7_RHIMU
MFNQKEALKRAMLPIYAYNLILKDEDCNNFFYFKATVNFTC